MQLSAIRAIARPLARSTALVRALVIVALLGALAPSGPMGAPWGAAAHAADDGPDPADYLPSGAGIRQVVRADADGDGRTDSVVLYTLPSAVGAPISASVLVLAATDGAPRVSQLFGPPDSLRGNPTLDPNGSTDIQVRDVTGDGRPEILLTVVQQYQEPTPRSLLWVFRTADPAAGVPGGLEPPPTSPEATNAAAMAPFRLEAFVQGNTVEVLGPDAPGGAGLRAQSTERRLSGPDSSVLATSLYRWRDDGYRLTARTLELPAASDPTGGPDAVALGYFAALARGDVQTSYTLLTPRRQAEQSPDAFAAGAPRVGHVEEVHTLPARSGPPTEQPADRAIYVRIVQASGQGGSGQSGNGQSGNGQSGNGQGGNGQGGNGQGGNGQGGSGQGGGGQDGSGQGGGAPAEATQIPPSPAAGAGDEARSTLVGTVRVHRDGDTWHVDGAELRPAPALGSLSVALPPGSAILETAQGDLRQRGAEDVGVVINRPGRFSAAEPLVLFAGAAATAAPAGDPEPAGPSAGEVSASEASAARGPAVAAPPSGDWQPVPLTRALHDGDTLAFYGDLTFEDVNADGHLDVVFGGGVGAHSGLLWVLTWDGSALAPLFQAVSNTPGIDLEDLDGDGTLEILTPQSGYCGSYASSPTLVFVQRWQDGAYRPASADYPAVYAGFEERAAAALAAPVNSSAPTAVACIQHMRATAFAFEGRPADTLAAYRAYLAARHQAEETPSPYPNPIVTPIYLADSYVEADLRLVLDRATSEASGWGPAETAALHLMLADALDAQAQAAESSARYAERQGDQGTAARQHDLATRATSAAASERHAAGSLAPDLEE